ncbi:MAG: glucosamine-6-phosphate deaminase [Nanoarchaeota archaeon]
MKVLILDKKEEVIKKAAQIVLETIMKKQDCVVGLAAGKTMKPLYKEIASLCKKKKIDFSKVSTFSLDEYLGLNKQDKNSFAYFLEKNLLNKVNIKRENVHFLDGKSKNIPKTCADYEKKIKKLGGIDLQILGIGENGHIGFNEPNSSFSSKTRKVKLSESTRLSRKKIPEFALTMGISTILKSKKIILLALGYTKAEAIKKTIQNKVTERVPATCLKKHPNAIVIINKLAASKLSHNKI